MTTYTITRRSNGCDDQSTRRTLTAAYELASRSFDLPSLSTVRRRVAADGAFKMLYPDGGLKCQIAAV